MNHLSTDGRPRRREYSAQFKTSVLEQCRLPGASLSGVALHHGIQPNLVQRWMREDRQLLELIELQRGVSAFVPLQLPPSPPVGPSLAKCAQPNANQVAEAVGICIEIQRAGGNVTVTWPSELAGGCGAWLREWLR